MTWRFGVAEEGVWEKRQFDALRGKIDLCGPLIKKNIISTK